MPEETKYAIKCTTDEQAEVLKNTHNTRFTGDGPDEGNLVSMGFEILTYSEAKELGLLGEKKEEYNIPEVPRELYLSKEYRDDALCNLFNTTKTKSDLYIGIIEYLTDVGFLDQLQETPKEENLVELILNDMHSNMSKVEMRKILQKHLSSK